VWAALCAASEVEASVTDFLVASAMKCSFLLDEIRTLRMLVFPFRSICFENQKLKAAAGSETPGHGKTTIAETRWRIMPVSACGERLQISGKQRPFSLAGAGNSGPQMGYFH
jgi:hypothetical protein